MRFLPNGANSTYCRSPERFSEHTVTRWSEHVPHFAPLSQPSRVKKAVPGARTLPEASCVVLMPMTCDSQAYQKTLVTS